MYRITIKTKYNTITLYKDNLDDEELRIILSQPYILEVFIEREKELKYVRK